MNTRGNRANRDRTSILADAKNLLKKLIPMIQRMPKIERIEGAPQMMKQATCGIIENVTIAMNCPDVRKEYIQKMFGNYGLLLAAFEVIIFQGLLTDGDKLAICESLERIEEGVKKWHRSLPASDPPSGRQKYNGGAIYPPQEDVGSNKG